MAKKRKKQAGGGLKGFILLAAIIIGALYLYQNDGKIFSSETIRTLTDKASVTENTKAKAPDGRYSLQLEIPKTIRQRDETIITHTGYTVSYNHHYKTPNWVAWELTRQETTGEEGRTNQFLPDPSLPEPRVEASDYTHSGYDRGHMAPAADMKWSKQAMKESFYMSNICPQNRKLNRDDWGDLEEKCREWAKKYGRVYIACGPIYDKVSPKRIGKHQVAVPDRFFKVVLIYNRKNPIAMGFLFENKAHHQNLKNYMVKVDQVEEETGLDFFSKVPDEVENRIESIVPEGIAF
ncbi:DNA/RNA non-specific endonuclease [Bacteroides sp. An269]|uniref:DNA/RNA non-specific endonuclease n=1 Tax=Bacteroides sp. An269 TaxID=1965613 RepID=UPI000B38F646|nr:DNA/RNA non-specific endonuclease [Bacteroides sp. An269]OUO75647.1 endonuclease [Bacteroides sp. An269]